MTMTAAEADAYPSAVSNDARTDLGTPTGTTLDDGSGVGPYRRFCATVLTLT